MPNGSIFEDIWIEEASRVPQEIFEQLTPRPMTWDRDGFGRPRSGNWRTKDGTEIPIVSMKDSHLINAMKFLNTKFGDKIKDWVIYKNLLNEAKRRNIDERTEWDN